MRRGTRIILYSHDTLGQGLRRSYALAAALTEDDPTSSALILTGSPLAGDFTLPERVDHVRLPGVVKRSDGSCEAEASGLDIDEVATLRGSLIRTSVAAFDPDLMIVDTEPAGVRGELLPALEVLIVRRRARIVLRLGDQNDDTARRACWSALGAPLHCYDEIWVQGPNACRGPTEARRKAPSTCAGCRVFKMVAPAQQSAAE